MAASRALILNADLRLQSSLALQPVPGPTPPPEVLIDRRTRLGEPVEIRSWPRLRRLRPARPRPAARRPGGRASVPRDRASGPCPPCRPWRAGRRPPFPDRSSASLPPPPTSRARPPAAMGRFQSRAPWPFKDLEGGGTPSPRPSTPRRSRQPAVPRRRALAVRRGGIRPRALALGHVGSGGRRRRGPLPSSDRSRAGGSRAPRSPPVAERRRLARSAEPRREGVAVHVEDAGRAPP